jgi:hypothetical protein
MNKKAILALVGALALTSGVANATTTTTTTSTPPSKACTDTTGECMKNAGNAVVGGVKDAGTATVAVGKSVVNTVGHAATETGNAIKNTFSSSDKTAPAQPAQTGNTTTQQTQTTTTTQK